MVASVNASPIVTYDGRDMPAPKFATSRDPGRPTLGTRQAAFAEIWLRQPLMPWQRYVVDVAGEVNEDGTPRYPVVVVTGPRQGGKSHLSLARTGERCFSRPRFRAWYTAQTGGDARDQFLKFDEENLNETPLRRFVKTLRGNGHEVMKFPNQSTIRPHPPTETSLHGKQSDQNDIDEAWAFTAEDGAMLMQAIAPTQLTRPHAQTWIWSAGGTAASTWLAEFVSRGRAADPDIAYFEWGIPDDMSLEDLAAIATYHPAYGHTVTLDSIRKLRTILSSDAEFARAVGNRWTEIIGGAIPAAQWKAARHSQEIPADVAVSYGAARAADGSEVAIAAAANVGGLIVGEVLEVVPHAFGAELTVMEWIDGQPVAVDPFGPSATLADALTRAGATVLPQNSRDTAAGVDTFLDGLAAGVYRFRHSAALDAAVKVAGTRRVGDGGKAWARVSAGASIAALEAASQAAWALTHRPAPSAKPRDYFPGMAS